MEFWKAMENFPLLRLRMTVTARQQLKLPSHNKGNTLRGAFGTEFRRLVCVPECREARTCPLDGVAVREGHPHACPYREIFEPAPLKAAGRLSKNQDAPRPFVFRPPSTERTTWDPGESFDFELLLFGRVTRSLPWFVLTFRSVLEEGFGLNRARCELRNVVSVEPDGGEHKVYDSIDPVLHEVAAGSMSNWIRPRVEEILTSLSADGEAALGIEFLTPTLLKADESIVQIPEFHHLFKRLRDRINALSTFYGPGPIEADFAGLGRIAEEARTTTTVRWDERYRHSSRTGQRHPLSGFVGRSSVEMQGKTLATLLPWLAAGEITHVGRYTVWGSGEVKMVINTLSAFNCETERNALLGTTP